MHYYLGDVRTQAARLEKFFESENLRRSMAGDTTRVDPAPAIRKMMKRAARFYGKLNKYAESHPTPPMTRREFNDLNKELRNLAEETRHAKADR